MKGLILKDFYMITKYCRSFVFIIIVFLAVSCFGSDNTFFLVYPTLIAGLIPISLISYDEREKWSIYSTALPYTRAQIVSSKYLIGLFFQLAVLLLLAVAQAYRMVGAGSFVWNDYLSLLLSIFAIGIIGPSLVLPFIFRFGAEKGRIAYYVVIGALCAAATAVAGSGLKISEQFMVEWMLVVIIVAAVILYAISWGLSILFYRGREL